MVIDDGKEGSDSEDREAKELAESSKILMDIYGNKIKQNVVWFFENEIAMKDKPKMGKLQEPPSVV